MTLIYYIIIFLLVSISVYFIIRMYSEKFETSKTAGEYIENVEKKCNFCCIGQGAHDSCTSKDHSYCDQYIKYKITECERDGSGCRRTSDCFKQCFKQRQHDLDTPLEKDVLEFCRHEC